MKEQRLVKIETNLDDTTIGYPTSVSQIRGFEHRNSHLGINVFSIAQKPCKETPLYIVYKSKCKHGVQIFIDLLYHNEHYFPIFHLSRLLHMNIGNRKRLVCRSCLFSCSKLEALNNHKRFCDQKGIIYSPSKDKVLKFDCYKDFARTTMLSTLIQNPYWSSHQKIALWPSIVPLLLPQNVSVLTQT